MIAIIKFLLRVFYCNIFYKVTFVNKEVEENLDKCIICPNHSNSCEPLWIFGNTKNINVMAKAELFENKLRAKILTWLGVFPIRRGEKDVKSLIHAINLFKNSEKEKLLIFPEGQRIRDGRDRGTAKLGPAYIAYKTGVPMIPVYITRLVKPFSKVRIIYGQPIYIDKELVKSDKDILQRISDELLDACYNLSDK